MVEKIIIATAIINLITAIINITVATKKMRD